MANKPVVTEQSTRTLSKYTFNIRVYGEREYVVFSDPARGGVDVAKCVVPRHMRQQHMWEKLMQRIHRLIMTNYDEQKRCAMFEVEFLDGVTLSNTEIKKAEGEIKHATRNSEFLSALNK